MNRTMQFALVALAFGAGLAIAAVPSPVYETGQPLTAERLNGDFDEIEQRLAALETVPTSYTTTEQATGGTWIDGKPIFRKVVPFSGGPNNGAVGHEHGASIGSLVMMRGIITGGFFGTLPYIDSSSAGVAGSNSIGLYIDGANFKLDSAKNWSGLAGYVVLEYTKP